MKTDIPIACSLDADTQKARGNEWRRLLQANLIERGTIPGGVRMVLRSAPGVAAELRRLIALENGCCAWINWDLEEGNRLRVSATAHQEQGRKQLEAWYLGS